MTEFDTDQLKKDLPFDTEATGDLTVEKQTKPEEKEPTKREVKLPEVGQIIMVNGDQYRVTYVNEGKKRISCEPCHGVY